MAAERQTVRRLGREEAGIRSRREGEERVVERIVGCANWCRRKVAGDGERAGEVGKTS